MIRLSYFRFLMLTLFLIQSCLSQTKGQWVECYGEAAVQKITNEEAQVLAQRNARLNAIEKVCGIQLQAETLVKDFMLAGDFIHSIAYGHVVEEKDLKWQTETIPPENPVDPPIILLKLSMKARVIPVEDKPDPGFKVSLQLNRKSYQSGDEVIVNIRSSKDCFITLINLAANDSVYVLYPNIFHKDNSLKANSKFEFPPISEREAGFHVRVATLPAHNKVTEIVKVIATKQKVDFLSDIEIADGFGLMGTPKMAVTQLAHLLSEIPISSRAEGTVMYTVSAKE
jgi:hypothetical protein